MKNRRAPAPERWRHPQGNLNGLGWAYRLGLPGAAHANRKGWDVDDIGVDVAYDHQAEPRRFEVEVRLPEDLSDDQLERLRRVAASCPVHRALEEGFSFQQRLVRTPRLRRADAA